MKRAFDGIKRTATGNSPQEVAAVMPQERSSSAQISPLGALLQKEVTRRESLAYIGGFVLTLLGVSRVLNHISELSAPGASPAGRTVRSGVGQAAKVTGYGSGPYGI